MERKEKELILRDVEQNVLYDSGLQYLKTVGGRVASMIGKHLDEGHSFMWNHGSFSVIFSSHVERCEAYMFIVNTDDKTLITISVLADSVFAGIGFSDGSDIKNVRKNALARHALADAVRLLSGHSRGIVAAFLDNL